MFATITLMMAAGHGAYITTAMIAAAATVDIATLATSAYVVRTIELSD